MAVCVRLRHAPRGADRRPARRKVTELWVYASTVPQCAPALSVVTPDVTSRRGSGVVGAKNRQRRRRDDGAAYHHAAAPKTSLTGTLGLDPGVTAPRVFGCRRCQPDRLGDQVEFRSGPSGTSAAGRVASDLPLRLTSQKNWRRSADAGDNTARRREDQPWRTDQTP